MTVTIAFNVLFASFCFSPGHLTVATSSFTPSKKHELAEYTPAPFFCIIRQVTVIHEQWCKIYDIRYVVKKKIEEEEEKQGMKKNKLFLVG